MNDEFFEKPKYSEGSIMPKQKMEA
jgi:hypothetical protein